MIWWIAFAIFLFLLCAAMLVAEVFVPSFGLISACALAALAGGLVIFFKINETAGWIGVLAAVVMIPTVLVFAYKIFPKSSFGAAMLLGGPSRPKGDAIADSEDLNHLLGKKAKTITPLRPVGMCDFDGKRLECVAESGYVDRDKIVEVIKVELTQLTVRQAMPTTS